MPLIHYYTRFDNHSIHMEKKAFRILVADDDEIAREVVSTLLTNEGYSVVSVVDGFEAINRLRIEAFQLLITDLRMPGADGIEVLRYAVNGDPDCAVVILTGYGTLDTTLQAIKEGAYDYLTKPFKTLEIIILAERAYKRAILIADNRELKKNLRDTYRDMELLNKVAAGSNPAVTTGWLERLDRLTTMDVLQPREAEVLRERLVSGNGKRQDINS